MFTNTEVSTFPDFSTVEGTAKDTTCSTTVTDFFTADDNNWTSIKTSVHATPVVEYFAGNPNTGPFVVIRLGEDTKVFLSPDQAAALGDAIAEEVSS